MRSNSFIKKEKEQPSLRRTRSTRLPHRSCPVSVSSLPKVKVSTDDTQLSSFKKSQSVEGFTERAHVHVKPSTLMMLPGQYTPTGASPSSTLPVSAVKGEVLQKRLRAIADRQQHSSGNRLTPDSTSASQRSLSSGSSSKLPSPARISPTDIISTPSGQSTPLSQLSSGSMSPAYPQMRTPEAAKQLSTFDLSDESSPLSYALNSQWGIDPEELPPQEKINIQNHCSRLLQTSAVIPGNDFEMCLLLQSYLAVYQTSFHKLFPNICRHSDTEPPVWPQNVIDFLWGNEGLSSQSSQGIKQVENFFAQTETTLQEGLISAETINQMDYSTRISQLNQLRDSIKQLSENLYPISFKSAQHDTIYQSLKSDIDALDIQLQAMISSIEVLQSNDFRNKKNWDYSIAIMKDTVLEYFKEHCSQKKFEEYKNELNLWQKQQIYPLKGCPKFIATLEKIESDLKKTYSHSIKKSDFEKYKTLVLSNQKAQISSKEFYYFFENQFHLMKVSHQPSGCLTLGVCDGDHDALKMDGETIPSCARSANRAVNMAVTRVTTGSTEVMKEVRCGVPYAFTIKNDKQRKKITHDRFLDMLTACGLAFFEKQMLDHFYNQGEEPKEAFELPVFYNCLLSPDFLRKFMSHIPGLPLESESLWCYKLSKRIKEFNTRVVTLPLRLKDGTQGFVKVKPNIFFFVNPCNQLSHGGLSSFSGTWSNADPYNEEAFKRLFGELNPNKPITEDSDVQKFFDNNPDLAPELKQELTELCQLLRYIQHNKLHHTLSDMPFILSNYISELGRIMNMAVVSGCKSAKDRTGNYERCNIEMAMQLHLSRKKLQARLQAVAAKGASLPDKILPPWDRWMTTHDFYNNAGLLVCSGQMESAMKNLGIPGFKTPYYMLGVAQEVNPTVTAYTES